MSKLSEKYFSEYINRFSGDMSSKEYTKIYGEIIALEAQQALLVSNPSTFPQEKYIDKLAEIVNQLEQIKIQENL